MLKSNGIVHVMLDQNSATRGQQSYKFMEIWGREALRSISPSSHTTRTLLFKGETSICCSINLCIRWLVCTLTGNLAHNLGVLGQRSNRATRPGPGLVLLPWAPA